MTAELTADRRRKFIAVEVAFFSLWWADPRTQDLQRDQWRPLLASGQVEFANMGWVMQDEIASHFAADTNQMTLGHRWIVDDSFGAEHLAAHCLARRATWAMVVGLMRFENY